MLGDNPCAGCIDGACMQACNRAKFDSPVNINKITDIVSREEFVPEYDAISPLICAE